MNEKLQLAVNAAIQQRHLAVNAHEMGLLRARMESNSIEGMPADQKRSRAWLEYGWPGTITAEMLKNLYTRQSLAAGAVDKLVAKCWESNPEFITRSDPAAKVTPWERKVSAVATPEFWAAFEDADRRRLVCRYSLLVLRVADSLPMDKPIGSGALVEMLPLWATEVTMGSLELDTSSPNFNKPVSWTLNGQVIHHSRVFIMGDIGAQARGYLEPGYNDFVNIEKLNGGVGESFLKNAARQMNINFDAEVRLDDIAKTYGVPLKELQTVYNKVTRSINSGSDVALITQGANVTPMTTSVPDIKNPYDSCVSSISSGIDMPTRILIGNQTGERASTEDNKAWNARCQSRRVRELSNDATRLARKLQSCGAMPVSSTPFNVNWSDLNLPTMAERLELVVKMTTANKTNSEAGAMSELFTQNEMREQADYAPLATQPAPLPDVEPEGDPANPEGAA